MANCKDNCIHYKVCMYGDLIEYKTEQILKDDCDDFLPKDVVPKSEVEKAKQEVARVSTYTKHQKRHYETKVKTNPEKMAKMYADHADWQRKNRDKWNAYQREWQRRKRLAESEGRQ